MSENWAMHDADYLFEKISDPQEWEWRYFLPTPYTNLPAFIELVNEAMDLKPPDEIVERFKVAVELANKMLAAVAVGPS